MRHTLCTPKHVVRVHTLAEMQDYNEVVDDQKFVVQQSIAMMLGAGTLRIGYFVHDTAFGSSRTVGGTRSIARLLGLHILLAALHYFSRQVATLL